MVFNSVATGPRRRLAASPAIGEANIDATTLEIIKMIVPTARFPMTDPALTFAHL